MKACTLCHATEVESGMCASCLSLKGKTTHIRRRGARTQDELDMLKRYDQMRLEEFKRRRKLKEAKYAR